MNLHCDLDLEHSKAIFSQDILSLAWAATSISFVATKVSLLWQNVCHDKIRFVVTKYFFTTKVFVTTNICHEQIKVFLRQTYYCRNKRRFLSWQTRICHDKSKLHKIMFVVTNICHIKHVFVMTKVLSRQAYLWQLSPMLIFWLMMIDAP